MEDFEENKLLYLSHKTTLNNLSGILESKKIYTDVDMWYRNTTNLGFAETENTWTPSSITSPEIYPGVYMTLINNELVGNKIDLESKRKVSLEEGEIFSKIYKINMFYETSAKANINIKEIFVNSVQLILEQEKEQEINIFSKKIINLQIDETKIKKRKCFSC